MDSPSGVQIVREMCMVRPRRVHEQSVGCPWIVRWTSVNSSTTDHGQSVRPPWSVHVLPSTKSMDSPWGGRGQSMSSPWVAMGGVREVSIDSPWGAHRHKCVGSPRTVRRQERKSP